MIASLAKDLRQIPLDLFETIFTAEPAKKRYQPFGRFDIHRAFPKRSDNIILLSPSSPLLGNQSKWTFQYTKLDF
jgi:hypothetical protein